MLLQRIRLKGFLGHQRLADSNSDGFVDIDLRSSPLWLIHGPNGGGKSSIWDAVTFALFKRHRGGGQNFDRLIHDATNDAAVELYFELPGLPAQQYRILSTITKVEHKSKKGGEKGKTARRKEETARTSNVVERLIGDDDWEKVPGTTNKADEWAQRRLGMNYDTFVCAVLLRQGEADAFMKALPSKRKKLLLELLQLEFYEELGKKANNHESRWKAQRDRLKAALDRIPQPTAEEIDAQRSLIDAAEVELARAEAMVEEKERTLAGAREASALLQQMESVRGRQRADKSLLDRAAEIEANADLYRELRDATRALTEMWEARHALKAESDALGACAAKVTEMEARSAALSDRVAQTRAAAQKAEAEFASASERLERAMRQFSEAEQRAKELERIEHAESEIREAEEELKPYLPILNQRQRIEHDFERRVRLGEGMPLLKGLADAVARLEAARGRLAEALAELSRREENEQRDAEKEKEARLAADALSDKCGELQTQLHARSLKRESLSSKLEARNEASGRDKCPTCGSELDEAALARIEHERSHWAAEVGGLEDEITQLSRLLSEKKQALDRARAEKSAAAKSAGSSRLAAERARSNATHAAEAAARAEGEVEDARASAGKWAVQIAQLTELAQEFDNLSGAPEEHSRLLEAQRVEASGRAAVEAQLRQLKRLPKWSAEERDGVRSESEECQARVRVCEREKSEATSALDAARAATNKAESEHSRIEGELNSERDRAADLAHRKSAAQVKYDIKRGALSSAYANHSACEDESALNELSYRLADLQGAEEEEGRLREARSRQEELKITLADVGAQLNRIPPEHRRGAAEVEVERDAAKAEARRASDQLQSTKEELVKLEEQKRVANEQRDEFAQAEEEYEYYRRLADAFGPSGLRARVVQSAQATISERANSILGRLSNGEWQVELRDLSENELEIQARNVAQPGARPRPFEYLSGGEKFRVAVSLAVAVGQSVLGDRRVDTLIIDEGFGSLDEGNRDLMAG
ncbi:MAG: SMC family ATPase, partial [Acidobacteriota bacterium]|nr:SMC family ATPase [Acidobacteriota bacterium]